MQQNPALVFIRDVHEKLEPQNFARNMTIVDGPNGEIVSTQKKNGKIAKEHQ